MNPEHWFYLIFYFASELVSRAQKHETPELESAAFSCTALSVPLYFSGPQFLPPLNGDVWLLRFNQIRHIKC